MLAVIIPTLNAGESLAPLLGQLRGRGVDTALPIIIADGGSIDDTLALSLRARAVIAAGASGRGVQLARGADWAAQIAGVATGAEWYLFLHADCFLDKDWALTVTKHMHEHPDKAGYFRFRAQINGVISRGWKSRFMAFCVRFRELTFGGPYGDQGLLISRAQYERLGGYDAVPLFEDVMMIDRIKAEPKNAKTGGLRRLPASIYTDVSAYARDGYLSRSLRNLRLLRGFRRGQDIEGLMQAYNDAGL